MTKAYLLGFIAGAQGNNGDCPYYDTMEAYTQWWLGYHDGNDAWTGATDEVGKAT